MPIRIGVQIQPQHSTFAQMQQAWRDAEQLGVDSIYTWDHFYPLYGEPDGTHYEGVASLTALAASTERVRVGALVFCNSYRNPQLLANVHNTIDQLSGGRVIFGIGAGWFERDYDEYGYEFGTAPERLRALGREQPALGVLPGYATICRFMQHHGLAKQRRLRRVEGELALVIGQRVLLAVTAL